jgi:glycosyltransferase involved in cell wall biosynthesis
MESDMEIIVVDGASVDNTSDVMADYLQRYPSIQYFRETVNSGVDADFDKAVGYAQGEYCWLLSDDDCLKLGAIAAVMSALKEVPDLVIVNTEYKTIDLTKHLIERYLLIDKDKYYCAANRDAMFSDLANQLSYIGCVVIHRISWLARERQAYYGSLFIHFGVIFQSPPLVDVKVIAEPLITVRCGNAMWTPRSFEVWMLKWPQLIWSFPDFSDALKQSVCPREPWRSIKALFRCRALGSYTIAEFRNYCSCNVKNIWRVIACLVSVFPASLANAGMILYFSVLSRKRSPLTVYDLIHSRNAGILSRLVYRMFGMWRY